MNERSANLLLDCLHQDARRADHLRLGAVDAATWEAARELSAVHGVQELLLSRLKERRLDRLVPAPTLAAMRAASREGAMRSLQLRCDLDRVVRELAAGGISVIVLKGAYLAEAVYTDAALRSMSDIDLLVPARSLARAATTLEAAGYAARAPYDLDAALAAATPDHLPRFVKNGAVGIELHWLLLPFNPSCDVQDVWDRAVPLADGARDRLALCPEDLLLHLCAHASYKHRFEMGLRAVCELAETIRRFGAALNWSVLVARARQWQWHRGTYLALRVANDTLGAAVPDAALGALRRGDDVDADEALAATARRLMLLDSQTHRSMPPSLLAVAGVRGTAGRAGIDRRLTALARRVFLPRALVARAYRVAPGSPKVLRYYPVRLKDLIARHGRAALQLVRGDTRLAPIAAQKAALEQWLTNGD